MPSDAAPGHVPDVNAFDNAIAQDLEREAGRLRNLQTQAIRAEEEVKQRKREHDAALAYARENFGTDDLGSLRVLVAERMASSRAAVTAIREQVDAVEARWNAVVNGSQDQQG